MRDSQDEVIQKLRRLISRMEKQVEPPRNRPRRAQTQIQEIVPGSFEETPFGPVFVATASQPLEARHGATGPALTGLTCPIPPFLARVGREPRLEGISLADLLFLDTETTGLATTSGTYAFLIGLGFVHQGCFIVEQLFMRDFGEEEALLWLLSERLSRFPGLVTYNGRSFDVPLLEARYITNRIFDPPIPDLHLDLLAPARKLWRARGSGCRLTELEREILRLEREGDVPGHLIPSLYFEAVHQGDARGLEPVFYHNRLDIVSLAALTVQSAELLSPSNYDGRKRERLRHVIGEDFSGAGRALEALGVSEAADCYRAALVQGFRAPAAAEEALCRLGRFHKRRGNRDEAMASFRELASQGKILRPFALIELAKQMEHQVAAFEQAKELATQALFSVHDSGHDIRGEFRVTKQDIEHRLRRLDARIKGKPWKTPRAPSPAAKN